MTEGKVIAGELKDFLERFGSFLPAPAKIQLETVTQEKLLYMSEATGFGGLMASLAILAAFRAAFSFNVADRSEAARSRTERGFIHLQQTIVVDPALRTLWQDAFKGNETVCERLGAVHLLSHGVWTFKAHGIGARTDLVCNEPLIDPESVERVAEALVLTEWKKVGKANEADNVAAAARQQAQLYGTGVLSTIELAEQRYIVLVSWDRLPGIADATVDGVRYRHVNISVNPSTPSKAL